MIFSVLDSLFHRLVFVFVLILFASNASHAALTVPIEVQMPGTQPGEVGNLESPDRCDNCHQSSDPVVNIAHDWRGSMMSHAGRDPIFWATVAVAEQDFDGAGDLCIRCHTMGGWMAGRSTPTDGSALTSADAAEGVSCDTCHMMTNPDDTEHVGVQNGPFIANDGGTPAEGHYGSGQLSLSGGNAKLGPYADAVPKHQWDQSLFHRSVDYCGSCHDVSNPVVGDLAPNNGAQQPLAPGTFNGLLDTPADPQPIESKAAFNNPPYKYGVVERTYSEYKAGLLPQTLVSDFNTLPTDLKTGVIQDAYNASLLAGNGGNYEDGTARYFSCQTCHMKPVVGLGANKSGVPTRNDLPSHDLTGGNYWIPEVMQYMDGINNLVLGGGLTAEEISGMNDGILRAKNNLEKSASLSLQGNTLKVVNLTGHKLISGYPEGRRMWLNIVWRDSGSNIIREDGEYGAIAVNIDVNNDGNIDAGDVVETLIDPGDSNTKVYEVHGAITQEWANKLIAVSPAYASVPVSYDRITGAITATVGDVAAQAPGTYSESFHFVLNNKVVKDNRIPPYGMDYDESVKRNILPVPAGQYGSPVSGGAFNYWDDFQLNPPVNATSADIKLMYQPTSWEYIEFLYLANNGSIAFLANEGTNLLDAWLNTGMAQPYMMAEIAWTPPDTDGDGVPDAQDNCPDTPNADQLNNDGDSQGDVCDDDDDNDGLTDTFELSINTNPFLADTDGDTISDYDEVNFDGLPAYDPGADMNPLLQNTDNDAYLDGVDPIPVTFNYEDGDVAPYGSPDTNINAADLLVGIQLVLGIKQTTDLERAHMDLYPAGAPDGEITLSDYLLLQQLVW
jgi:hypothetical protein